MFIKKYLPNFLPPNNSAKMSTATMFKDNWWINYAMNDWWKWLSLQFKYPKVQVLVLKALKFLLPRWNATFNQLDIN